MREVTLLVNIAVALVVAFFGGLVARRLGLPTIIGYLLAGIAIGPFTWRRKDVEQTVNDFVESGVLQRGVRIDQSNGDWMKMRVKFMRRGIPVKHTCPLIHRPDGLPVSHPGKTVLM